MLHTSTKPQTFWSNKEPHINRFTVEFFRQQHLNALRDEEGCPREVYTCPAENKVIHIICQTEAEALALAKWEYFRTGSDFKVTGKVPYERF